MASLNDARQDYFYRWKKNTIQHYENGDYDWVASLIRSAGAKRILEIGCGAGYSTLSIASQGIEALAIDIIPQAIEATKALLVENSIPTIMLGEGTGATVALKELDIFDDFDEILKLVQLFDIDLVLICNPGGKLETDLTKQEKAMLQWGKYPEEQMEEETVPGLHKWAILLAAAKLAKAAGRLLMIVDRGNPNDLDKTLGIIEQTTGLKGIGRTGREIQLQPLDGVKFDKIGVELYWGAGLYRP